MSGLAYRTKVEVLAQNLAELVDGGASLLHGEFRPGEDFTKVDALRFISCGEDTEVPNFPEALRQDVEQESANELVCVESHEFRFVAVPVVAPVEGNAVAVHALDSVVGNGDTVGVPSEIFDDFTGVAERRFVVDNPAFFVQTFDEVAEIPRVFKMCGRAVKIKLRTLEVVQEFSSELFSKHIDGNEELLSRVDPLVGIRQTAAGDEAVQVRVIVEVLPPSVKDGSDTGLCAEVFFVGAEFHEGFRNGSKKQIIHLRLILHEDDVQIVGYGENSVEILHVQEVLSLLIEPLLLSESLAFRAVAVATGVVGDFLEPALAAPVDVRAKCRSPAVGDGVNDLELLMRDFVVLKKLVSVAFHNILQLYHISNLSAGLMMPAEVLAR